MKTDISALRGAVAPRALRSGIRADVNPAEILSQVQTSVEALKAEHKRQFDDLKAKHESFKAENDAFLAQVKAGKADTVTAEKVDRINDAVSSQSDSVKKISADLEAMTKDIDRLSESLAAAAIGGGGSRDPRMANPLVAEYSQKFENYFRKGENGIEGGERALRDLEVKAALTTNSDPDGGFTVKPEMETMIDEVLKEVSPMRQIATVRPISSASYKKLVNQHGTASGWVGETESRTQTAASTLSELMFPVHEIYAMPAASQGLLDDSSVDIAAWLSSEVELEFAAQEGAAFISGTGDKRPRGILGYDTVADASYAWGKVGYVATGNSGAFASSDPADAIIDLYHAPKSAYRANGTFIMNRKTLGASRKLQDGQGNYLINMAFRTDGVVEEMLGRPVIEMPDMPDIAANSLSIAFGDFRRGYLIVDRIGIRVLRDPYTAKPYVLFYTTKRVGGGVQNFDAIKVMKFAAS